MAAYLKARFAFAETEQQFSEFESLNAAAVDDLESRLFRSWQMIEESRQLISKADEILDKDARIWNRAR